MTKWAMIVDIAKCHNCQNCFLSCKDEHVGNDYPGYAAPQPLHGHKWIRILEAERGSGHNMEVVNVPVMCQHCDDAPCIEAARDKAVYQRPDGIVIIDPEKAKGQKQIVDACPYKAIFWNEELELPQKWIFDAHLLDRGWKTPRCAETCPTGAMTAIKLSDEDFRKRVQDEGLEPLNPEFDTKPRVLYKNLHLYKACFVSGSVIAEESGISDVVVGARVTISQAGKVMGETETDGFGDFKIDQLEPNSGAYELEILGPRHEPLRHQVMLEDSQDIGLISLNVETC